MIITQYKEDSSALIYAITSWYGEVNKNKFGLLVDINEALKDIKKIIEGKDSALFVMKTNNAIVGFTGVVLFNSPISKQKIANEHYYYVMPEYRGLSSIRLINTAVSWARKNDCSHFIVNASELASNMHDKVCKLYMKLGFKKFETSYIMEI